MTQKLKDIILQLEQHIKNNNTFINQHPETAHSLKLMNEMNQQLIDYYYATLKPIIEQYQIDK